VAMLNALKTLGLRISVDDFGTGYSSLSYLKRFPVDALKIDQSFVRDVVHDTDSAAIVKAVISLAHILNLRVIAEGVETEAQCEFLRENGCDEVQGYYFGRPMSVQDFGKVLLLDSQKSS
jgi:EAL domain-containing protein (putative c-di-GMP-specific phosphodiesterase class I)